MTDQRSIFFEVGALCGHPDPDAFADVMMAPPCAHHGPWFWDDETCDEPCGQRHERCCACYRPMKPECPRWEGLP